MIEKVKRHIRLNIDRFLGIPKVNNIESQLKARATDKTCVYIEKNMDGIHSQSTALDVLSVGIEAMSFDGLVLEFGVFSGRTINHISKALKQDTIYGFDSFEGLPETWRDGFKKGHFELDSLPKVNMNVKLIKGWFDNSLPPFIKDNPEPVSLLHVDCDLYSSTKTIFDILKNQIVVGTIIVFDEYFNYPFWEEGEFKALDEFTTQHNVEYEYLTYNRYHEQVAIKITRV